MITIKQVPILLISILAAAACAQASVGPLSWPGAAVSDVGHFVADVIPFYIWGN